MSRRPSHRDLEDLLGAFALHALPAHEAIVLEAHLPDCPRCRAEVTAHRETASLLVEDRLEPPTHLWDRIALGLDEAPPPIDLASFAPSGAREWRITSRWLAAAAVVISLLGLGSVAVQQLRHERMQAALTSQEMAVEALAAFNDPTARLATLRSADGALQLRAVLLRDGTGYVLADHLPDLAEDRAYQLWAMVEGEPRPVGLLGARPAIARFEAAAGTTALAISVERAGGTHRPTLPVQLTGLLES